MGTAQSIVAGHLKAVASQRELDTRLYRDPGLPTPILCRSFWMTPPAELPKPPDELPEFADIVIIGSGITGASIARTIMATCRAKLGADLDLKLKVVVLEARDACEGATGRNGGHLKPRLYDDYRWLKRTHGAAAAQKILQFRLAHVHETIRVAEKEGVLDATGAREVESIDVFRNAETFVSFKERFLEWERDAPLQAKGFVVYEAEEARQKFGLSEECKGAIVGLAGAIHPYRLVTAIWKRLASDYPEHFSLFTRTACTGVIAGPESYTVETSRGTIQATHVVHATNAYSGHLLPKMRGKLVPMRATCTAQRPGQSSSASTKDGARSWLFFGKEGPDEYVSQLPGPSGEIIVGGGNLLTDDGRLEAGNADDSTPNTIVATYLGGVLPIFFGSNWGREADYPDAEDELWTAGRVKSAWSGIVCLSADRNPWVGRIPPSIAGRSAPATVDRPDRVKTAAPGEWLSASYDGDGMSTAFLCGRALAYMIIDKAQSHGVNGWFPEPMLITEKRWTKANPAGIFNNW